MLGIDYTQKLKQYSEIHTQRFYTHSTTKRYLVSISIDIRINQLITGTIMQFKDLGINYEI